MSCGYFEGEDALVYEETVVSGTVNSGRCYEILDGWTALVTLNRFFCKLSSSFDLSAHRLFGALDRLIKIWLTKQNPVEFTTCLHRNFLRSACPILST